MCTPQEIIEKIGCLIIDEAVKKAIKAASYVCHYKANLENLEAEMRRLEDRWEIIERKVREANDHGEEVEAAVSHWQTDVDGMKQSIQRLVGQRTAEQNMHCFVCSCPNIKWRYRLSKLAEERTEAVKKLTQDSHFDEISHHKPPPPELEFPSNENYVTLDSRTPILKAIMDALNDPKVNMIGVHGLGGVGKTRLVEEVRKRMRENGTFKQAPLATVSKNPNVKDIQSKLAGELFFTLDAAADDKIRASRLWDKLSNGEKYLVILDDIWREVDLKAIGIPITEGKTGCKVVLTSRNEGLIKKMKVDRSFQIAELSELEAWTFFKKKVGDSVDSPELYPLASKVCQHCKGLPVAINAIGAALEGKQVHAWKNALDKLESCMLTDIEDIDPSVFASLRVTYDMLNSKDAKSCFLTCCSFPDDGHIPIDDLTRHCVAGRLLAPTPHTLDDARNAVHTVVDTLKSYSLLSDGREGNIVRMHDVIREIGIRIACDEKAFLIADGIRDWPETPENGPSYSVISIRSGNINQLPDELSYPQLHTLIFEYINYPRLKVPDRFLSGMKKLTVLVFNGMCLLPFPSSLGQLANLRMLCLNQCELGDIKILGDLKTKLEVLSLRGSNIEALPPEIGQLTSLLSLDLRECNDLSVIPQGVIFNLTKLEELYIPDRFDKWKATTDKKQDTSSNVSLDELRSLNNQLTTLHIHIPDVLLLPKKQLKFENLKWFKISVGSMFEYSENFPGTSILKLVGIPLKDEFKALVHKAEVLYLQELEGLKKVLHDRADGEEFLNLKYLRVKLCLDLEYLLAKPKSVSFSNLSVLIIQSCGNLRYLFSLSCARGLLQLERLEIKSSPMEEIVGFDGEEDEDELTKKICFSKLKYMLLQELPKIISFYPQKDKIASTDRKFSPHSQSLFNEKVVFPALEELGIYHLPQITQIFDKELFTEESFCQLRDVHLQGCKLLVNVFPSNMLSRLQNLKNISVDFCEKMEVIISMKREEEYDEAESKDNVILLPHLASLRLVDLNNLKSFYSSRCEAQPLFNKQVIFPVLEELEIERLPNITELWDKQSHSVRDKAEFFCQLVLIHVSECEKLMNLIPSSIVPGLQNLVNLKVQNCPNIEVIVFENAKEEVANNGIFVFSQLLDLDIFNMKILKSFCTNSKMSEAQPFFNHQVSFPSLERLTIWDVPSITEIWDNQPLLDTKNKTGSFYKLSYLNIKKCANLVHVFPHYMLSQLQINLDHLVMESCPKVEVIVSKKAKGKEATVKDIIVFRKLMIMMFYGLENLKSFYGEAQLLFDNKVIFPVLDVLEIHGLPNITEIWDKQSLSIQDIAESFCQLVRMQVSECENLMNLIPSNMVPRLQKLRNISVQKCPNIEVVVFENAKEEVANDDIFVFSQVKAINIINMKNLKSFCANSKISEAQPFFNPQVAFPSLETMKIQGVPNITEIWDKQPLLDTKNETVSHKLNLIKIKECGNLVNVFPYYMLPQLQMNLHLLEITNCPKVEVIFSKKANEKEAATKDIIVFQKLWFLRLKDLENLKSFCAEAQLFVVSKDTFPVLEGIYLDEHSEIFRRWTSAK
ncbi:Disease resistance protein [Actinidia chinensis var. chinensis]|uniref:Disease resistance protein n=1 Tax=Actinidia chinensis var. chinensis TaxID=1590841 RepID=A0A2R6Q4K4_ACTCC|nr:Disease resistance protein [Actinidia chinensis var. chinensis]